MTIVNSEEASRNVIADYRLDPERVVVFENGVDLSRFQEIEAFRPDVARTRPRAVGLVANLRPVKGPDVFLHALARLSSDHNDVVFRIAGEGEMRPRLERLAKRLEIWDRVQFCGTVETIPSFLAQLDVAVLSSRSEGLSNSLLEYMAAGRPIVATSVGGNSSLIDDGINGLLVDSENSEAMARAIGRLLLDTRLASEMGKAAQEKVRARFGMVAKVRELESFYASLADRDGTP